MRTLYLVRHDPKAWKNGKRPGGVNGHQHDPPLQMEGRPSPQLLATMQQVSPVQFDRVYTSPFLRTRQTTNMLMGALQHKPQPEVLTELGEYLGNHKRGTPELTPDTASYYPNPLKRKLMLSESIGRLELRVKKFLESLPPAGTFLVVSHGLVLSKICGQVIEEGALLVHTID